MSDSWISENEDIMDTCDRWEREADRVGIHEDWQTHPVYVELEEPQIKDVNVWVSVSVDTSMSYETIAKKLKAKLDNYDWDAE